MKHDEDCAKTGFPCCEDTMCVCDKDNAERLKAENARLQKQVSDITSEWTEVCAENVQLREALNNILHSNYQGYAADIAREALKGKE
jgi:hypothetical protein